jgi:hypothetical protein
VCPCSWPVLNGLPFPGSHGHERLETSHIVCGGLRKRLPEADGPSFGFAMRAIRSAVGIVIVDARAVILLILAMDGMRPVHDRRPRRRLLLLDGRAGRMRFDVSIAVDDGRLVLGHGRAGWGGDAFAAARIFGRRPLYRPAGMGRAWVRYGAVVPRLTLVLVGSRGRLLRCPSLLGGRLDRLRGTTGLLLAQER